MGLCIRHLLIYEVDFEKVPHRIISYRGFLHFFIGEVEPVLHEVHAEHNLNVNRFVAALIVIVIKLNNFNSMALGNDFLHGV